MKSPAWTASAERGAQFHHAGKLPPAARAVETALALAERDGEAEAVARSRCVIWGRILSFF